MAEKSAKKKPKKAAKADPGVLGNLRSTRPQRIGGDRRATAATRTRTTATAAKPKATAAKAKPAAAKPAGRKPAAKKPAATKQVVKPPAKKAKPAAAPPAGWQTPEGGDERRDGGPTELVTTAVQAAGELAQIGLTVGGQILRRAANRIPGR